MIKKIVSIMISAATVISFIPQVPAKAEEIESYPYTLFAGSNEEGALTINSNTVCINGNIATNGTISTTAQYFNVNGMRKENAQEEVKMFFNKIDSRYFKSYVETYLEDYSLEDTNINVNIPIEANGNIDLTGNINITSGIKALNAVILSGNVENTQDSVICSKTGDITINTDNLNLNGLVYAPNGSVNITAQNLNLNSVIIIADTITITCPNLNANYNAQMAEFIGNAPDVDVDLEINAYGNYDEDEENFEIYWNTTVPKGTFDIQASDDGENYISIGSVIDENTFEYSFTEFFEKKYIKVIETTYYGEVCESVPFLIIYSEDGYDIKNLDIDEDSLPDIYELKIGTDINEADTDKDGLTDYQEYVFTKTDPLVYDSVIEGTSDADADNDEDGISNIDEFTIGTYPWASDTDNDGLNDYDEIFVYNTDPLVADSDEDGVDDGSEIKLRLDPNDPATNGVTDGEYVIPQSIEADSDILSSVNTAESPYELSIDIKTNGDAEKELTVDESGYSAVITNDAMLGASIDVEITDACNPEEIVLKYKINAAYTDNTLNKFSSLDEFKGIKRLNVFKFDEEQGMLLPVETQFDAENNQLYAEVNETGTYCLMDMEIWLDNLDVKMPVNNTTPAPKAAPKALSATTSKWEPEYINTPIDLVFILQTTGDDRNAFVNEKGIILKLSSYAFSNNENVNVYIITFDQYKNSTRYSDINGKKLRSMVEVKETLDRIKYNDGVSQHCDRSVAFNCLANNTSLRKDADVFVYRLINGNCDVFLYNDDNIQVIQKVSSGVFKAYSEIFPSSWHYTYSNHHDMIVDMIANNKDLFLYISEANLDVLKEHLESKKSAQRAVYNIILPTKWKKIALKDKLVMNGYTNSDDDPLTDWQEVDRSKIKIALDGNIELPTFCVADMVTYLSRFNQNGEYNFIINDITPRQYLPILSDPTDEDTDDDGINDDIDPEPLKKAYLKQFGTEEYKKEVEKKASEGKFVHEWYMTPKDIMARNFYNSLNDRNEEIVPAYIVAKTKLDIMMQDVNDCEQYLFTVSDENWLKFCLFFNECVQTYGEVDEELHYFRLKLNRAPETLQDMIDLINSTPNINDKWIMCCPKKARFHMFGDTGAYNIKFISSNNTDNIYEAIYDKNGNIITENDNYGKNMGTYNYASSSKHSGLHKIYDVKTYEDMKNTYQDYLHKNDKENPDDNIIYDKYPRDKKNPSEIDYDAQNHYIDVCDKIGIDYNKLIKEKYSDKCY